YCYYRALSSFSTRRSSDLLRLMRLFPLPLPYRFEVSNLPTSFSFCLCWIIFRRLTKVDGLAPVPWRTCFPVNGLLMRLRSNARRSEEHTSELQSRFDLVCR